MKCASATFIYAITSVLFLPSNTHAGDCESGYSIKSVLADGKIIVLDDGSQWEVDSSDISDSATWVPGDDITVCSDQLVNTDEDETVDATRIK